MIIKHITVDGLQIKEPIPSTNFFVVIAGASYGFLLLGNLFTSSRLNITKTTPIWEDYNIVGTTEAPFEVSLGDKVELRSDTPFEADIWVHLEEEGTRKIYSIKLPKGQTSASKCFSEMIVTVAPETAYSTPLCMDTFQTLTAYSAEGLFVGQGTPEVSADVALGINMAEAGISEEQIEASGGKMPVKPELSLIFMLIIAAIMIVGVILSKGK